MEISNLETAITIFDKGIIPAEFSINGGNLVNRVLKDQQYSAFDQYGIDYSLLNYDTEEYSVSVNKRIGTLHTQGNLDHLITLTNKKTKSKRIIEVEEIINQGCILVSDQRVVELDLSDGRRIEISSTRIYNRQNRAGRYLPEPLGNATILPPDLPSQNVQIINTNGAYITIYKEGGDILVEDYDPERKPKTTLKREANSKEKVLFEMAQNRYLGGEDFSLKELLEN